LCRAHLAVAPGKANGGIGPARTPPEAADARVTGPATAVETGTTESTQHVPRKLGLDLPLHWMVHNRSDMTTNQIVASPSEGSRSQIPAGAYTRLRTRWLLGAAIVGAFAIDQMTKGIAVHVLSSSSATVGGLHLHLVANRGILMGFPAPTAVIVLATIGVAVVALRAARGPDRATAIAYGLVVGGALGNLVDRVVQRGAFPPQAVVDWISFGRMTFNLADVFIVAGLAMVLFSAKSTDHSTKES